MKTWFITLIFVLGCLPVVTVKAAPPQTYVHLDYEIINGDYNIGDGTFEGRPGWQCSNKIQIPKNVDKLYFSAWHTHFVLFFSDMTYIGFYHEGRYVIDYTFEVDAEVKVLGVYYYGDDEELIPMLNVPTNATHIVLQTCSNISAAGMEEYLREIPIEFNPYVKPLIYYPVPADAATNMTFGLMPALMIMIVIAGLVGGLIMITKKSKR